MVSSRDGEGRGEGKVVVDEMWGRDRLLRPAEPCNGNRRGGSISRSPGRHRITGRNAGPGLEADPPPSDRATRLGRRSRRVRVMPRWRSIHRRRASSRRAGGWSSDEGSRASARAAWAVLERTERCSSRTTPFFCRGPATRSAADSNRRRITSATAPTIRPGRTIGALMIEMIRPIRPIRPIGGRTDRPRRSRSFRTAAARRASSVSSSRAAVSSATKRSRRTSPAAGPEATTHAGSRARRLVFRHPDIGDGRRCGIRPSSSRQASPPGPSWTRGTSSAARDATLVGDGEGPSGGAVSGQVEGGWHGMSKFQERWSRPCSQDGVRVLRIPYRSVGVCSGCGERTSAASRALLQFSFG